MLMVPFVVLIGVAVDMGQLLVMKNQLAAAVDAAALGAAGLSLDQAQTQAQAFVSANFSSQNPSATLTNFALTQVTLPDSRCPQANAAPGTPAVYVTDELTMKTAFLPVIGYSTLSATVSSCVTFSYLEVVLVLDNTDSMTKYYGSMRGIDGVKQAATALVNTLLPAAGNRFVRIGIVPFTTSVNVLGPYTGVDANNPPAWIDTANKAGSMSQENIDVPSGTSLITFAQNLANATYSNWAWGGCVRQRTETDAGGNVVNYDIGDDAPNPSLPDTLYTPFFAPSEPNSCTNPGTATCAPFNSYIQDGACKTMTTDASIQSCIAKYPPGTPFPSELNPQGTPTKNNEVIGPNANCIRAPIVPLTNDPAALLDAIDNMVAAGNTVIPAGLEWGWHLISPKVAPVVFPDNGYPRPYSDTQTIKVIILMTDGQNYVLDDLNPPSDLNGFNGSVFNAYGYANGAKSHLTSVATVPSGVNQDLWDYNLDQKELALCSNIKAVTDANGKAGRILLYTIGYGSVISSYSLGLLQTCATDANSTYFYNPTADELNTTFTTIAQTLSKLRIAH